MEKWRRSERITVMTKYLLEKPNTLLSLNEFTTMFSSAKSSISEDISIIRDVFHKFGYGKIETMAGRAEASSICRRSGPKTRIGFYGRQPRGCRIPAGSWSAAIFI